MQEMQPILTDDGGVCLSVCPSRRVIRCSLRQITLTSCWLVFHFLIWSCNYFPLVCNFDTPVVLEIATVFRPQWKIIITLHYNQRWSTVLTILRLGSEPSRHKQEGMPQGSWLSPLVFLVMIDDLTPGMMTDKFMDDTTVSEVVMERQASHIESTIAELESWSFVNRININTRKKQRRWSSVRWCATRPINSALAT